jgi:calcineurin-like phosphoesterase family protein
MGRYEDLRSIITKLRGKKILIRGNHDHQTNAWYVSAGFKMVVDWLLRDDVLFIHKPATSMCPDVISLKEQAQPRLIVHGHIHDSRPDIPGHFNVAWDRHKCLLKLAEVDTQRPV